MPRKRYGVGHVRKRDGGRWRGHWRENGVQKSLILGRVVELTKSEAKEKLAAVILESRREREERDGKQTVRGYVNDTFLTFYRRKWKKSTALTTQERMKVHVLAEIGQCTLDSLTRDDLQALLDQKAKEGLSESFIAHLRWDLKQIFRLALGDGLVKRNPAEVLFTPKGAKTYEKKYLKPDELTKLFGLFDLRERLILKLGALAGLRPGEIFALKWGVLEGELAKIRIRLYRTDLDSPKTKGSVRDVVLGDHLLAEVEAWRQQSADTGPEAWVFPSERMVTPITRDNCWRRHIFPKLREEGLEWVNFQVLRRSHSSLMSKLKVDPKVVADQLGHSVDVNQNVYTKSAFEVCKEAVTSLEQALNVAQMLPMQNEGL